MGLPLSMQSQRGRLRGLSPATLQSAGSLLGLLLALLLRASGQYALGSVLLLGALIALGLSELVPLQKQGDERLDERGLCMPFLEQAIGYLLTMLWLDAPSLLGLCVGFFLYRFLDVYPTPWAKKGRREGSRSQLLAGQLITGTLALCCMSLLRMWVLPELWSVAR